MKDATIDMNFRVTALVGANGCGKSNLLRALVKFNRGETLSYEDRSQYGPEDEQSSFIQIRFVSLTESESDLIRKIVAHGKKPVGSLVPDEIEGVQSGGSGPKIAAIEPVPTSAVENKDVRKEGNDHCIVKSFELVKTFEDEEGSFSLRLNDDDECVHLENVPDNLREKLIDSIPEFLFFESDIELLGGSASVSEIIDPSSKNAQGTTWANLLRVGNIADLPEFGKVFGKGGKRIDDLLHKASSVVTSKIRRVWTQNPDFSLNLVKDGISLKVYVLDASKTNDSPEDRGLGEQWFLSFYLNFIALTSSKKSYILLLDEPAIHIHPDGQRNVLRVLEQLSENFQIVYTSHLPYMIDKMASERTRLVLKSASSGTSVEPKPWKDKYVKLRDSLGMRLVDSYIVGEATLVVEGPSDKIILSASARYLTRNGRKTFDSNTFCISPGFGADNAAYFFMFLLTEGVPVMLLLDFDDKGRAVQKRIVGWIKDADADADNGGSSQKNALSEHRIVVVKDYLKSEKKDASIEDLIEPAFYVECLLETVKNPKGDLNKIPGICKDKQLGILGVLNGFLPAGESLDRVKVTTALTLAEKLDAGQTSGKDEAVANIASLLVDIQKKFSQFVSGDER